MKNITVPSIVQMINGYLSREYDYSVLRNFVYSRYEAEEDIIVAPGADDVLSVVSPYMETEEVMGDEIKDVRLRRLATLLSDTRGLPPSALSVLALEYDEIAHLFSKQRDHLITADVYREQVRKLSPAKFDVDLVLEWADKQYGQSEPNIEAIA